MGVKFSKALASGSDGTIVCDPRGGWMAKMGLQDNAETQDWTELRIGAYVSLTGTSDTNEAWSAESIASTTEYDRFLFGLKDSDSTKLINVAGTYFWGIGSKLSGTTSIATNGTLITVSSPGTGYMNAIVSDGTTLNDEDIGSDASLNTVFEDTTDAQATSGFARFIGLQLIRANPGAATQTVQFYASVNGGSTAITDTSESALRTLLNNFSSHRYSAVAPTIDANTGAAAFNVPDYWYIRWPFVNSRLRIHSAMYVVVSP